MVRKGSPVQIREEALAPEAPFGNPPIRTRTRAARLAPHHGEGAIPADEAPRQRGHHRPRRPRQDHPHGGHHEGALREERRHRDVVRPDRQRPRGARARDHHRHGPRGVRDRRPALRPRRLPRPRRLRQEHGHGRRADGRGDPRRRRHRRPDAADARAHPARPPGRRALHRGVHEQGRPRRRRGAPGARRDGGPRAALELRVPRRRPPGDPGLGPRRAQRRAGVGGEGRGADVVGRRLHPDAGARRSTVRS